MTEQNKVAEIQKKISDTTAEQAANEQTLKNLREERAKLFVENENNSKITSLDKEIATLCNRISNNPAVVKELQNQLAIEQARIAQEERDTLLETQNKIAEDIENLSSEFISLLEKADEVNTQLRAALTAYSALQQKTGENVLSNEHCQGSADYLRILLETMQSQFAGQHAAVSGAGIIPAGVEVRI